MIGILILAGGRGSRLGSITKDIPKPMISIKKKVFLEYLFNFLIKNKFKNVFVSVGYKKEIIKDYFKDKYKSLNIKYITETKPLGTGGAIYHSLKFINNKKILVINGDTFFNFNLKTFIKKNIKSKNSIIVCRKSILSRRYGNIEIDQNNFIKSFIEKKKINKKSIINGGYYFFKRPDLLKIKHYFSFEKFLQENFKKIHIKCFLSSAKFIDIGIKKDLIRSSKIIK